MDKKMVKCIVWDLDNTLWNGVLLEDDHVALRPRVRDIVLGLDSRGILQSIASKNDHELAMRRLEEFGIAEYFLHPQINWNHKSESISAIAELIDISLDTVAFIDDQAFERDEVRHAHSQVRCIDAEDVERLLDLPETSPAFITADAKIRRQMYLGNIRRKTVESEFTGAQEEFLASLDMRLTIGPLREEDLRRAEELTVRTNQLNSTGLTYSCEELSGFIAAEDHDVLICDLEDKYGPYGKIGLALVQRQPGQHTLKLLLMSCRVMSRGIGAVVLNYLMQEAKAADVRLLAEYVANDRNRTMYIAFKFAGFREIWRSGKSVLLESDLSRIQAFPSHMQITVLRQSR